MLDCKIPPILVLIITAGIVVGIPYIFPFYGIRSVVLSVLFIVLGVIIALLGVWEFRKSKTTLNPTTPKKSSRIVDTGLYRFSRNPMYLGMAFMLVGLIWGLGNYLSWLGFLAFMLYITHFQILPEEKTLKEIYGEPYNEYLTKVRRWL